MKSERLIPVCFSWRNKPPPLPPSHTNEWVKLAASGPLLRSPCSQAARLPVPDGGDSRPPAPTPLSHCDRMCRVFAQELACFTVNLRRVSSPFPDSLACLFRLFASLLSACVHFPQDRFSAVCDRLTRFTIHNFFLGRGQIYSRR